MRQAALAVKQLEEVETMNKELDEELKESQAHVTDELEEQKKKVCKYRYLWWLKFVFHSIRVPPES